MREARVSNLFQLAFTEDNRVGVGLIGTTLPAIHIRLGVNLRNQENSSWGWRDGSVVKSVACSSKGPEFNSRQPHGGSQPSVMGSGALFMSNKHTDRQNTVYIINK